MAQYLLVCLILVDVVVGLAMASENAQTMVHSSDPPAEAPVTRKLGKHQSPQEVKSFGSSAPSEAPQNQKNIHSMASIEPKNEENVSVEGREITHLKKHHHSVDKSVAGGGVILGGLATTFLVVVFCYIKATGRHKAENQIKV